MAKQFVYRIQDKNGRGPFRPDMTYRWYEKRDDRAFLVPFFVTWADFRPTGNYHYACGCTSVEQLKRWFSAGEYQKLLSLGFKAVRIDVAEIVRKDDVQCIFKRKKALHKAIVEFDLYKEVGA